MRAAVLALCATVGCVDALGPEVGPPLRAVCSNDDSDPSTTVSFRDDVVGAIFASTTYKCESCHTAGGATPLGLVVGGLDLGSYDSLRRGGTRSGADIVVPGRPCDSILYQKVVAGPPYGARMPLDGPPYLDAVEVGLIHDWIAEGAHAD